MDQCPDGDWWQVVSLSDPYWDQYCLISPSMTLTMGLSAPSASLQMTPSWLVRSTHLRDEMSSRGTWVSSRSGHMWTSWGSARPCARSCTWVGATQSINTGWAMKVLRAALPRRTWGYWWMKSWTWADNVHLQPRKPAIFWAVSREAWPAGQGRSFCSSTLL